MKKLINTNKAPAAIGPYSQGIQIGDLFFFSGQIPLNPETGEIVGDEITSQTTQVLENIHALLASQEMDFSNVVKTTVFLENMDDFAKMNEIYAKYFVTPYPARSAVGIDRLPKGVKVEIEIIASK